MHPHWSIGCCCLLHFIFAIVVIVVFVVVIVIFVFIFGAVGKWCRVRDWVADLVERVFSHASEVAQLQARAEARTTSRRQSVAVGGVGVVATELQIEAEKQGVLTEQVYSVR